MANSVKDETDVDRLVGMFAPFNKELQVEPKQLQPYQHLVKVSGHLDLGLFLTGSWLRWTNCLNSPV